MKATFLPSPWAFALRAFSVIGAAFILLVVFELIFKTPVYQATGLLPDYGVYKVVSVTKDGSVIRLDREFDMHGQNFETEIENYNLERVVRPSDVFMEEWFDMNGLYLIVVHNHRSPGIFVTIDPDLENAMRRFRQSEKTYSEKWLSRSQ